VAPYGRALGDGLERLGYRVTYVDVSDVDRLAGAITPEVKESDLAISVGAMPLRIQLDGTSIWEVVGKKFVFYLLDPIFYDVVRVQGCLEFIQASTSSDRLIVASPDKATAGLVNSYSPGSAVFSPFAGFYDPLPRRPEQQRIERVAVIGTIGEELVGVPEEAGVEGLLQQGMHLFHSSAAVEEIVGAIEAPEGKLDLVTVATERFGLEAERLFTREACEFFAALDSYEKRRRRLLVLDALGDLPVDFYGAGWQRFMPALPNARTYEPIPHDMIGEACLNYSALLNFDPNWDHGVHPRAYTALGHGCRLITNRSAGLAEFGADFSDLIMEYDGNRPRFDGVDELLGLPPSDPAETLEFRARHSWYARVDRLVYDLS
jgi:hypothetical protein